MYNLWVEDNCRSFCGKCKSQVVAFQKQTCDPSALSLSGLKVQLLFESEKNELLNDIPNSLPSPLAEMAKSWVCSINVVTP